MITPPAGGFPAVLYGFGGTPVQTGQTLLAAMQPIWPAVLQINIFSWTEARANTAAGAGILDVKIFIRRGYSRHDFMVEQLPQRAQEKITSGQSFFPSEYPFHQTVSLRAGLSDHFDQRFVRRRAVQRRVIPRHFEAKSAAQVQTVLAQDFSELKIGRADSSAVSCHGKNIRVSFGRAEFFAKTPDYQRQAEHVNRKNKSDLLWLLRFGNAAIPITQRQKKEK